MRNLPVGGLLIVIGLLTLWLAITGRLDRLASAWDYVKGATDAPGATPSASNAAPGGGIVHPTSAQVAGTVATLMPTLALSAAAAA